ncbi:alcohol dehydrogenase catalytic domain-containing protein [Nonomuraea sp. K274]|uniref:Alcohol dehydrogenase catalytic domain-containing protein n=1 Tax=Nonomuraea cypriaca TaxID=1187855 RepID=A0A931F564_9ACTN|nr:alcohol dehydrogenase catalytic domain-containing protein [Nonomuraea cypriaca]MBF8191753.1 alcohol dehydrogenase catalytic domain-containing protein [Nonomuraea cypriaca]
MRALVFHGAWDIGVEERPDPRPGPGEVVIDVLATGICGSDIHGYTGENGRRHPGQVMGHETVGRVAALGEGVTGPPVGTLATVNPVIGCGRCAACAAGDPQSCASRRVIGVHPEISAAFAEAMTVPAANVVELPETMPHEYGALVEPLAVGYHAARRAGVGPGERVLVIGGGPIGQAAVLAARRLGASSITVSEPNATRRALAATLGAHAVESVAGLEPATVVIDAVGSTVTLADALSASTPGARIALVGMHTPRVEIPAYAISTEERTLIGSFCYSVEDFRETARWVAGAPAELAGLVNGRVGMAEAAETFRTLGSGQSDASKILVVM